MKRAAKNILFIMFDQLRFDYLSCAGHPHLHTPHIDALAEKGVRFTRAYAQSTICGASRMSFYTGRYVQSHGAAFNNFPLKVGELTLGDHLRKAGMDAYLVGKTHMTADSEGMERLGIPKDTVIGARVSECGFDIFTRDDGLWAEGPAGFYDKRRSPYNEYLKSKGYEAANPWHDYANSSVSAEDDVESGWLMKYADRAANIREQDSETPWLTGEAIRFMEEHADDEKPWLCHLSYIKPHWPYIVPAPYHDMYGPEHILPVQRHDRERGNSNAVHTAFMSDLVAKAFQRDEVREKVIPAYMGLIKQCDDQMGRLFKWMEDHGRMDDTLIVLTSDHGDYLGDHWMGEKDFFHDCSVKIPMIVYDPSSTADESRGTTCNALVEAIDLAATFAEYAGAKGTEHIIEGHSLKPLVEGHTPDAWRECAVSEYDYSPTFQATTLNIAPRDARLFMITDARWKFIHDEGGSPPLLFDLENDPEEFFDLGQSPTHRETIDLMYERLGTWGRRMSQRTTITDDQIYKRRGGTPSTGVLIGHYDGTEIDADYYQNYRGKAAQRFVPPDGNG
ncbi:MAG: sulfatase-like hydrolase/transferase [Hyphomicrobiales bacterium]